MLDREGLAPLERQALDRVAFELEVGDLARLRCIDEIRRNAVLQVAVEHRAQIGERLLRRRRHRDGRLRGREAGVRIGRTSNSVASALPDATSP